jgi:hypothetical protein
VKSWHYILSAIITLIAGQAAVLFGLAADAYDQMHGIEWPTGINPFAQVPALMWCVVMLSMASLNAHAAMHSSVNGWAKGITVFVALSCWNRFMDWAFFDPYTMQAQELIFLIASIGGATVIGIKWQRKHW